MTKIYTLVNVLGEWIVDTKPPTFTNDSLSGPVGSFVLDPQNGNELFPTAEALQAAMRAQPGPDKGKDASPHCLWIAVAKKSIRVAVNFNGDRIAKVELEDEELAEAFYITRHGEVSILVKLCVRWADTFSGQKILVGITTTGSAIFYSLPFLEYITRLELYYGHKP